jgi:hypothetical protein
MYDPADLLTTAWPLSMVAGFVAEPRRQTTLALVAHTIAVSLKIAGMTRKSCTWREAQWLPHVGCVQCRGLRVCGFLHSQKH